MALSEEFLSDEIHPIDIVETLAEHHDWDFDRVGEDQIAMAVEGQWRTYSITLAWSPYDETLRLICSFEMEPPEESLPELFTALNTINDQCWAGSFSFWAEPKLMVVPDTSPTTAVPYLELPPSWYAMMTLELDSAAAEQ